jgi:hypothetical protein
MSADNAELPPLARKLSEFKIIGENDPNELFKHGFLNRGGVLGLYGKTGIGKSSLSMQMMILFALGRPAFGITPSKPLRSLLIQAENDDRDIVEMREGVIVGLGLSPDEVKQACDNIMVIQEDSKYGQEFFDKIVQPNLEQHKPDMLWIDPALAFLGGDAISQEVVGAFLRNMLNPLLKKHQCAAVVLHHMNKTGNNDTAYAGSGSAEWANMPRAVLTLAASGKNFELTAAKRGNRLRWTKPDGKTRTLVKYLNHSAVEGQIYWIENGDAASDENSDKQLPGWNEAEIEDSITALVPQKGIMKEELVIAMNIQLKIGLNRAHRIIDDMIRNKKLFRWRRARGNARAGVLICLMEPPAGLEYDQND